MAFLAARPIIMITPICMYTLFCNPAFGVPSRACTMDRKYSENNAPKIPTGTDSSTANGTLQLS